jgi:hypothetical protein
MTLTEFLLARITEDEIVALESKSSGDGAWVEETRASGGFGDIRSSSWDGHAVLYDDSGNREDRDHILRWDPARVLRECEAKRRIIENHERHAATRQGWGASRYAVQCLATVYADHPDYLPEWRL